jgi:hypothetical protein
MARRRRRRVRLGSSPQVHAKEAGRDLHDLQLILQDMEMSQGPLDCRLLVRQLHSANAAQGAATAHVYAMSKSDPQQHAFKAFLDKLRTRVANAEHHFTNACLR